MTIKDLEMLVHKAKQKSFISDERNGKMKTYSLTKQKVIKPLKKECVLDNNGIPEWKIIQQAVKKTVPDTNGITKMIVDYCKYYLGSKSAERVSSEGRWRKGIGYIPNFNKGAGDVECLVNGKKIAIELKATATDKQRESQIKYQKKIEADKGIYILVEWGKIWKQTQDKEQCFRYFHYLMQEKINLI